MDRLQLFDLPRLVLDDGGELSLWRTQFALLAYLSLEGVRDRSAVAGLLWPDVPESAARGSLRQLLHKTRKEADGLIEAHRDRLALSDRVWVDAVRFQERLDAGRPAEAVGLYTGDFLARFELPESPAFGHWADGQRERLRRRLETALRRLQREASEAGRWDEALGWADRWTEAAPFSEEAWGELVLLHAQRGDRARALAVHDAFRTRLREALGAAPGAEFERLADRIREALPKRFPAPAASAAEGEPAFETADLPLVGREAPFAELGRRWEAARGGRRQVVVVTGETGIGKSRLAREFATRVGLAGATVARADAYEAEREVPYAVLAAVLRSALDAPGLAAVDAGSLGELTRILPELAHRWTGGVAEPSEDPAVGRLRLLDAAASVVDNLAYERPLLVVLDDLPWADSESLAVLHYACRQLPAAPWMLLATARSEELEPGDRVTRLLARLRREGPAAFGEISLSPLDPDAVSRLLAEVRPDGAEQAVPARLHAETGGNPLFLAELLRARAEGGGAVPAGGTVGDVVRERLARLSSEALRLLEAGAVLGRRFPLPLAARVARLGPEAAREAVRELSHRHLVRQVAYAYDFAHDVVRRAIYGDLPPPVRRAMHRRAYEGLLPARGSTPPGRERASALAKQAALGKLPGEAYRWNMEAAERASGVYAGSAARRFLDEALRFARDGAERRRAWEAMGDLQRRRTRFLEAAGAYRKALEDAPSGSPERVRLRIALLDVCLRGGAIAPAEAEALRPELGEEASRAGPDLRRDLALVMAECHVRGERIEAAAAEAKEALAAAREAGEPASLVHALLLEARVETFRRRFDPALELMEEAGEIARSEGLERRRIAAQVDRGLELSRRGRWTEAAAEWREALALSDRLGDEGTVAVTCLNLADLLIRQSRTEEAEPLLDRAARAGVRHDFPHVSASVGVNRALLAWFRGETARVRDLAEETARAAAGGGFAAQRRSAVALTLLAELELPETGPDGVHPRTDDVDARLAELESLLEAGHWTWSADWDVVCIARARARLALGEREAAVRALDEGLDSSVDAYTKAVLTLEKARILQSSETDGRAAEAEARATLGRVDAVLPPGIPTEIAAGARFS